MVKVASEQYHLREEARLKEITEYIAYESTIFHSFKSAVTSFTSWSELSKTRADSWKDFQSTLGEAMTSAETEAFYKTIKSYTSELKPEISTSCLNDECARIIKEGVMLRPKRISGWKDRCFVLTSAGYLHEFNRHKDWENVETAKIELLNTINLSECILGSHSLKADAPQEFELLEVKSNGFLSKSAKEFKVMSTLSTNQFLVAWRIV